MQHIEHQTGSLGLTRHDILASLAIAAVALMLTPVIGLLLLLIG